MSIQRIALTGGTGFVGRHFSDLLRERGHELGPDVPSMREVAARVGEAIGRRPWIFPLPVGFHRLLAQAAEATMKVPLVSVAQVKMLAEGLCEPAPPCDDLPDDLRPRTRFAGPALSAGLPEPGPFGRADLRLDRCRALLPEGRR